MRLLQVNVGASSTSVSLEFDEDHMIVIVVKPGLSKILKYKKEEGGLGELVSTVETEYLPSLCEIVRIGSIMESRD